VRHLVAEAHDGAASVLLLNGRKRRLQVLVLERTRLGGCGFLFLGFNLADMVNLLLVVRSQSV